MLDFYNVKVCICREKLFNLKNKFLKMNVYKTCKYCLEDFQGSLEICELCKSDPYSRLKLDAKPEIENVLIVD